MISRRRFFLGLLVGCVVVLAFRFATERLDREPDNYSLIEDGLYMGGRVQKPPPGTKVVLNLDETADMYQCDVHVWEPIRDNAPAPTIDWLRRQVEFVDRQRQAGNTTFVHCFNGASRSGLVVIAYIMFKNHWPRDRALEFVRSKRPATRPNPAFMELLVEWERVQSERSQGKRR